MVKEEQIMFKQLHRRMGQFLLAGAEPSLPKKFFVSAQKTAMLACKITLPDSPHPIIISKNPGFWALYLANSIFFVK